MRILVTGADGFVGRNLCQHLAERSDVTLLKFTRSDDPAALGELVAEADYIVHLAGVNRPQNPSEFEVGNVGLTADLVQAVQAAGRPVPIIYASSTQAALDNPYGQSKRKAEELIRALALEAGSDCHIFRLPNIFGKWCKPNYNSAVATFCHNVARDIPIVIHDENAALRLVYVDDVVGAFVSLIDGTARPTDQAGYPEVRPVYETTVGEVANRLRAYRESRDSLVTERVGAGFDRALYATYVSYLPTDGFSYTVPMHSDARGTFVEMLKTRDSGQFSFFTAYPGVTRGGHYHHSKTEKFLVIKGQALFRFRHMLTGELHELKTSGDQAEIVETVPGWTHDITNIGPDEMLVMLWANEIFDRDRPDTFSALVG